MLRKTIENERASSADLNSTNLMAPHSTWLSPLDLYFTSSSVLNLVRNNTLDSKTLKAAERRQGGEWGECPNETLTKLNLDSSKIASIQVNFLNRMENREVCLLSKYSTETRGAIAWFPVTWIAIIDKNFNSAQVPRPSFLDLETANSDSVLAIPGVNPFVWGGLLALAKECNSRIADFKREEWEDVPWGQDTPEKDTSHRPAQEEWVATGLWNGTHFKRILGAKAADQSSQVWTGQHVGRRIPFI